MLCKQYCVIKVHFGLISHEKVHQDLAQIQQVFDIGD